MEMKINILSENLKYYLISCMLLPINVIFLTIMYIYRQIVFKAITLKHKPSDITWLNSSDVVWAIGEPHHNTSDLVIILNSKSGDVNQLIKQAKQNIKEKVINNKEVPKLKSALRSFMGYSYLLKIDFQIEDCITVQDLNENQELRDKSLNELIVFHINERLPLNNNLLWNFIIIKADSGWKARHKLKDNQFVAIFRFHHIIADGMSTMNFCIQSFADNSVDVNNVLRRVLKNNRIKTPTFFVKLLQDLHLLMITPGFLACELFKKRNRIWKGVSVTLKRRVAYVVENGVGVVDAVKSMKRRLGDTGFTEIMLNSISASLQTYFEKNNYSEIPEYALMGVVYVGALLSNLNNKDGVPELKNQYSYVMIDLPIQVKSRSLMDRLKILQVETRKSANSPELWVNNLILSKVMGLLPKSIINAVVPTDKVTMGISNLPFIPKISMWNGHHIENIFIFAPLRGVTGLGFSVLTYDNRLHLGLTYDEAISTNQIESQNLVNGIFKNIELLRQEIENKF